MENNSLGRLLGVLVSPKATFKVIAERPTWLVALIVLILVGASVNYFSMQKIDYLEETRTAMERRGQEPSDEQVRQIADFQERFGVVIGLVSMVIFYPAVLALIALVFLVAFRVVGGELDFVGSFSVFLHGLMPGVLASLLSLPVILSRSTLTAEELQRGLLMSNLGAFAPEDASGALVSVLSSIDVFSIWTLALLVIGYGTVAAVSRRAAIGSVLGLWVAYVVIKTGWLTLTGSL